VSTALAESLLITTAGLVFWISPPIDESKLTSQISPRRAPVRMLVTETRLGLATWRSKRRTAHRGFAFYSRVLALTSSSPTLASRV
jgi:hypothetical protein